MQGIESLDNFKSFVSSLGGLGRFEDTYIVHAAEGETVVPMEVLDRNPALKKRLFKTMMDMGIQPGRYIVGNELNSKNPVTGQPEFFLKKIVSQIRKALPGDSEKFLGTAVGLATGNPFLGALAGGIGSGAQGALAGGLTGFQSPGIAGLTGDVSKGGFLGGRDLFGRTKTSPLDLTKLLSGGGSDELSIFLRGTTGEDASGLLGSKGKFIGQDFFTSGGGGGDSKINTVTRDFIRKEIEKSNPELVSLFDDFVKSTETSGSDSKRSSGHIFLANPQEAVHKNITWNMTSWNDSNTHYNYVGGGTFLSSTACTGFALQFQSDGTNTARHIGLYGIK